jgi:hypothetical protein
VQMDIGRLDAAFELQGRIEPCDAIIHAATCLDGAWRSP